MYMGMSPDKVKVGVKNRIIGGCGLYRSGFDYIPKGKGDYDGSPEYYFLRQGITNIYRTFYERQNPAPESEQP